MRFLVGCSLCFVCTACGVYKTSFDCPAGKGIGCAPVNDVLDMIVEREEGEDLFITDLGTALAMRLEEKKVKLYLVKEKSGELVFLEEIE